MKKLFLIRHAKSSWENPDLSDFERPLNNRGIQNAPVMAKRFIKKWNAPQILLCSPATRAKQTAEYFKTNLSTRQPSRSVLNYTKEAVHP